MAKRNPKPESEQSIPEMVDDLARQEVATWYKNGKLTPYGNEWRSSSTAPCRRRKWTSGALSSHCYKEFDMRKEQTELSKERRATTMTKGPSLLTTPTYDVLVSAIEGLVLDARAGLKAAMNAIMLQTYWRTGEHIVEYEHNGSDSAIYGAGLMRRLAHDLTLRLGRGFAHSNLNYMRKFYLVSQKVQTSGFFEKSQTSGFLTWSHYLENLRADEPLEIALPTNDSME